MTKGCFSFLWFQCHYHYPSFPRYHSCQTNWLHYVFKRIISGMPSSFFCTCGFFYPEDSFKLFTCQSWIHICDVQVTQHFFHKVFIYPFSRHSSFFSEFWKQFKNTLICVIICYLKKHCFFQCLIKPISHFILKVIINHFIEIHSILGHPKTKAFITHGGSNGIYEAIYHGIPMVGLPLFADQPHNIVHMTAKGAAIRLDLETISTADLLNALKEVINNPLWVYVFYLTLFLEKFSSEGQGGRNEPSHKYNEK